MENDKKKHDVLYGFVNKVVDERNKERSLVFVDDKLLEWVDEQVGAGKYRNRSHAIECALAEVKEGKNRKGGSEVSGYDSPGHLTRNKSSLYWNVMDEKDRRSAMKLFLALKEASLGVFLAEHFGDNLRAKIDHLEKVMKDRYETLATIDKMVYKKVLKYLKEELLKFQ